MNAARRKQIEEPVTRLQAISSEIETIKDEEQEYLDAMPENMQQGEKADAADEAILNLDSAQSNTDTAVSDLEGIA